MKRRHPKRKWNITIADLSVVVSGRTFGNAVRKAANYLGLQLRSDKTTGGWHGVAGHPL